MKTVLPEAPGVEGRDDAHVERAAATLTTALVEVIRHELRAKTSPEWIDQDSCAPLSKRQFLDLIKRGELPAHIIGKRRVVLRRDFNAYIAKQPRVAPSRPDKALDEDVDARVMNELGLVPSGERR